MMAKDAQRHPSQPGGPDHEVLDPTPIHIPGKTDRKAPLSLREEMQRFVRQEISKQAGEHQLESFEEADDFEVEDADESILTSEYSVVEMEPVLEESLDGRPAPEDLSSAERVSAPGPTETEAAPPEGDHAGPQPLNEAEMRELYDMLRKGSTSTPT